MLLFARGAGAVVSIDWVTVGNPGNANDTTGFGGVSYAYQISRYEITAGQYTEFLNAVADTDANGLVHPFMGSTSGISQSGSPGSFTYSVAPAFVNKPVAFVSFFDALRFANWLHNGQPNTGAQTAATTEAGAYTFTGPTTVSARNPGAIVFLTSESEWYKAAYYNPMSSTYFTYPTSTNTVPTCAAPTATANRANCVGGPGLATNVGSYPSSASPYGTFDQGGNVIEWNEGMVPIPFNPLNRSARGGSFLAAVGQLASSFQGNAPPTFENSNLGFRVARLVPNGAPVANAGVHQTVPEGTLVVLDGSASHDPEGSPLTYDWIQTSGPPVTLDLSDPPQPTFTAPPVPPAGGLISFDLTVSDPQGSMSTASVEITITNVNAPPEADAGPDQLVAEGAPVALDGGGSLDPDGDALGYAWTQTAGPPVTLVGAGTAQPTFTAPQVGIVGVTLGFELSVDDGQAVATDAMSVFVTDVNLAPTADAGPDQAVDEGDSVALDGTGSSDPDGDALAYEWSQVGGPLVVLSNPDSASPGFTAPAVPASGATVSFQLVVRDGSLPSDPDYVDVTVKDVNHLPVADAGDDQSVAEASPVALDASSSYDLDGDALSFGWAQVAGSGVVLSGAGTATPSFTAPLVGVLGETLTFEVTVGDGIGTAKDRVDVFVENVNHPPAADAGSDQTVNEGASVALDGTASDDPDGEPLAYQWSQPAGPAVTLSNDASPAPSFAAPQVGPGGAQLEFELVVNDGLAASDPDRVVITVQNVNDPPLCGSAQPSAAAFWPPNHKLVAVGISGVSDPNADDVVVTVTGVTQDEPVKGLGDGDSSPDAVIGGGSLLLRSERSGIHDGRVYRVQFTASDGAGSCTGSVLVCVPHDRKESCTDSGQVYDSTAP